MNCLKTLLLAGGVGFALAGTLQAETYRAATFIGDSDVHTKEGFRWFFEEVDRVTNGELTFELFTGGVLIPAKTTMQGVADGIAQAGFTSSGYTPSELPVANALSWASFVERDPLVTGLAWADFVMHNEMQYNDFRKNGVIPVGGFATPPYDFICNTPKPLTSIEDVKGIRVRSPGGLISNLVSALGMVPVAIPAQEMYQALETGQLDCAGMYPSWLNIDNSLAEVSRSVTTVDIYSNMNSPIQLYDADFWQGLSTEHRKVLIDVSARSMARTQINYGSNQKKALEMAEAAGHEIVAPDDSLRGAIQAWVDNGMGDAAGIARKDLGIADPEALFAEFMTSIDKWRGLVAGLEDRFDEEELTALIRTNLTDTVDPATYGMD